MAYKFKTLGSVEALTEVPENANALVEVDGAIKRVPGGALGGGGEYDLVITDNLYDGICTIDSGSYQNVYNKIMVEHDAPKILVKNVCDYVDVGYSATTSFIYATIIVSAEDSNDHYLSICYDNWVAAMYNEHSYLNVYPDNSVEASWQNMS